MKKILIIQNKRIGDVLLSSIIANNIKKKFPRSEVTFFTYDYASAVLENNPYIDRIITVKAEELKKISNLLIQVKSIRRYGYDIIFDPYSKFQSRIICLFSNAQYRIGFKRKNKTLKLPFYTHPVNFLDNASKKCGKAIEDRVNIVTSIFPLEDPNYTPKVYLKDEELSYELPSTMERPVVMVGILGSTPQKSMPHNYMVEIIDFITTNFDVTVLFNYAPHQENIALEIYEACKDKSKINMDMYESSVRGFLKLLNKCAVLVANEGGSVHMAKALDIPTFTIYSPYILKEHWASFEDGKKHDSIHLLDFFPDLFETFERKDRKAVEKNPKPIYNKLTPALINPKLNDFLKHNL